jgi:hypothetical protein
MQCYSLWFDPTEARTHDLPHSPHANHYATDAIGKICRKITDFSCQQNINKKSLKIPKG